MPSSQLNVHLYRDSFNTPWGFRLQGGKDLNQPLTVQRVFSNSPAEGELQRGDIILAIGGGATSQLSHKGAQDAIKNSGGQIDLVVMRPPPGCVQISPISPPIVTQRPRAPSLQEAPREPLPPMVQSLSTEPQSLKDLQQRFLHGLQDECTPGAADYVRKRLKRLRAIARADPSPPGPNPRRPNNIQYNQHPHLGHGHKSPSHHNNHNMNHQRHNQPIHVHIEPSRPTAQTTYYLHTPSPQPQLNQAGYFNSNDPYGTMPRRQRGYSQPPYQSPTTPTIPPPPWATQQSSPKKVSKLSKLGGGGTTFGTNYQSSTLPRYTSHQNMAQHHARRPQRHDDDEADADDDLFANKKPTGPPPKVCNLNRLGGGGINFASGMSESQTLPRRNIQRRLSQPPSMPSRSPYGVYQGSNTPAQRFEPGTQNGIMLNRVQSSLDNITLSPRTPDGTHRTPFYQAPGQDRQFYTPTSLLLEQQKMEEDQRKKQQHPQQQQHRQQQQQEIQYQPVSQPPPQEHNYQNMSPQQHQPNEVDEGEEPIVPVWERRKQFQQAVPAPQKKPGVRTPKTNPIPTVSRPAPGNSNYSDFGLSYRPQNKTSTSMWQPVPAPKPAHAAPEQVVHYSSTPSAHVAPQSPVKSAAPSWQRPQTDDDTDGKPAWRNTLRATGVKPWDVDLDYQQQEHEPQRSVSFNPTPYQNLYAPGADSADMNDGTSPGAVHLQYNSPIGLYSKENVDETYRGQVSGLTDQQPTPDSLANQSPGQGQGLPGGRDWSQSQVLQFIQQDKPKKTKGKMPPATAPKPHAAVRQFDQNPQQAHQEHHPQSRPRQHQERHQSDIGISDF